MVANRSFQTTSARAEVPKQSNFNKEANNTYPYRTGFRRNQATQSAIPAAAAASTSFPANAGGQKPAAQRKCTPVSMTGRLGRDAVVRYTINGHLLANFSVAVDESYKDLLGEWRKKTAWHRVKVWDGLAETVNAGLRKGVRVYVEGRLVRRDWIDRENKARTSMEIVAKDVRFLDAGPRRDVQIGIESSTAA